MEKFLNKLTKSEAFEDKKNGKKSSTDDSKDATNAKDANKDNKKDDKKTDKDKTTHTLPDMTEAVHADQAAADHSDNVDHHDDGHVGGVVGTEENIVEGFSCGNMYYKF